VTTYDPNPTIEIAGLPVSNGVVLNDLSVTMGRTNVLDQPSPGYARASLWTTADIPIPMQLSDEFQIFIETPSAGTVSIFNGIISDIEINLASYGSAGSISTYTITAVGPLASLQRKTAGLTNYPKEYDGTRVLNILTEAFLTEWDDVGPTVIWTDIPNGVTWASYDGINITLVNNLTTDVDTFLASMNWKPTTTGTRTR
jgi:hypothetical protein